MERMATAPSIFNDKGFELADAFWLVVVLFLVGLAVAGAIRGIRRA